METMRERFTRVVTDLLGRYQDCAVVLADIGHAGFVESGATTKFPERVINLGIREQSQIGFAAGLALEGYRPIVHSYAPFLVQRPYEQLKLDLSHQGAAAILVSVGASFDGSGSGRTHQASGDVALIKTLPDWRVYVPGHPDEVARVLEWEVPNTGNVYIRLQEEANSKPHTDAVDKPILIRRGAAGSPAVLAIGPTLDDTRAAVEGLDVTLIYMNAVMPFPASDLAAMVSGSEIIVVEPYLAGTAAADIAAALSHIPHRSTFIGVPNMEFRKYGEPSEHRAAYSLDVEGIRRQIGEFLAAE